MTSKEALETVNYYGDKYLERKSKMSRITHEEAKGYVESIETDGKLYSFECKGLMLYINQQEKQQKLLELYKEKDKLKDFFAMGSIRAEKYKKIEKQIKEQEDENNR